MNDDEITIRETTQVRISGHRVGAGNIWERELPDEHGVIAPRLSAVLSIQEIATEQQRHEKVFTGNVVTLGQNRYQVVTIEEGESGPGSITLRRLV